MTVQFKTTGVPLFKSTGVVAMDADCCCEEECLCDVPATAPTACNCQTADYAAFKTFGTVTVTISGSSTPTAATSPGCSAPASCSDVVGTYVIACEDDQDQYWRVDQFVCSSGGWDYYYANTLRITYTVGATVSVRVRLGCNKVRIPTGDPNPYPTVTPWGGPQPTGSIAVLYQHLWSETNGSYNRWFYVLGGDCTTECNTSTLIPACNVSSGSVTPTTSYISGSALSDNVCHPSSLSVAISITAAA